MIRMGIATLLKDETGLEVVGEVATGTDVIRFMEDQPVDIVLMDIYMPEMNGMEATKVLKKQYPDLKILAISMHDEYKYIKGIIQAGADGYILKHTEKEDLVDAIKSISEGKQYFSQEIMSRIVSKTMSGEKDITENDISSNGLTKREVQVLALIAREYTNKEIADELSINIRTVDTYKRNLLKKLKVKNVVGLVKYAINQGLLAE